MIADTTFASDYFKEQRRGVAGRATAFLNRNRALNLRLTIITAGEISVLFPDAAAAHDWISRWRVLNLNFGVMEAAADIDRELIHQGKRLGENDNWIAGFARYYREPLVSLDRDFNRVAGLRRLAY